MIRVEVKKLDLVANTPEPLEERLETRHPVYLVNVETGNGQWKEEFTDIRQAQMFVRGVKAGTCLCGDLYELILQKGLEGDF